MLADMIKSKKVLFIVGSHNQTTIMHQIYDCMPNHYDCYFSTFYADGFIRFMVDKGWAEMTTMSKRVQEENLAYYEKHGLKNDYRGDNNNYDLVFACQDVSVPKNILNAKIILVQEGILEPVDWRFYTAKTLKLPRALADTSMTGLSDVYDVFCVFSEGYKKEFIKRGANGDKIMVTGVPNFDNAAQYKNNTFPYKHFVLAATSNHRETKRSDDRKAYIKKVVKIANGRKIIFKLHPREDIERAMQEIKKYAPEDVLIFAKGNTEEMIANCDVLVTTYSTVILTAASLGKEIHCDYSKEEIEAYAPLQTNGSSAKTIADIGIKLLKDE